MIIPAFVSPTTGNLLYHVPGTDEPFGFSIDSWLGTYTAELTQTLAAEGQGRELVEASIDVITDDRYILNLKIRWADGRSASIRETVLLARFTPRTGYHAIASIGGVPASQS